MKAKELIQKWKSEGVSDKIIRKRLIVLSQQYSKLQEESEQDLDETHDRALEEQLTQTQIEVPQVNISNKRLNLFPPYFKLLRKLIIFCLAVNLVSLIYLMWSSGVQKSRIGALEEEVRKIGEILQKMAK